MKDEEYENKLGSFINNLNKPKEINTKLPPKDQEDIFYKKGHNEAEDNQWHRQFGFTSKGVKDE